MPYSPSSMRKHLRSYNLLIGLFVCSCMLVLAGCAAPSQKTSGYLRLAIQWDISIINPHKAGVDICCRTFHKALFEGLTRLSPEGEARLALAESVVLTEGGTRYTFTLRPALWSNGAPITAHDFVRSWRAALLPDAVCPRADLMYLIKNGYAFKTGACGVEMLGVRALNARTLEVTLEHPAPYFLSLLANPLFSPLWESDIGSDAPSVFSGPFALVSWERHNRCLLEKNPRYWDSAAVSLQGLEVLILPDPHTAVLLYEQGALDWIGRPFVFLPEETITAYAGQADLHQAPIRGIYWFSVNTQHPMLCSAKVRRALSLAIDRNALTSALVAGRIPARSLSAVTDLLSYDPAHARVLLAEGLAELGYTLETLPPLEIAYTEFGLYRKLAESIQQMWQNDLYIPVRLIAQGGGLLVGNLSKGLYQVGGIGWFADWNDPYYALEFFQSASHAYNTPRWDCPAYQDLLLKARTLPDAAARNTLLHQAECLLLAESPILPIYFETFFYLQKSHVQGVYITPTGLIDFKYCNTQGNN